MAKALSLSQPIAAPGRTSPYIPRHCPRLDFARIDRFRESKVASVRGGSGGSLPSIGVIMEHHIYAYTEDDTKSPGKR
jgi:hypothetical protein